MKILSFVSPSGRIYWQKPGAIIRVEQVATKHYTGDQDEMNTEYEFSRKMLDCPIAKIDSMPVYFIHLGVPVADATFLAYLPTDGKPLTRSRSALAKRVKQVLKTHNVAEMARDLVLTLNKEQQPILILLDSRCLSLLNTFA